MKPFLIAINYKSYISYIHSLKAVNQQCDTEFTWNETEVYLTATIIIEGLKA